MPFRLGPWEIGIILVIILIVFGVGKLPQIGGAIGKTIKDFRKAQHGDYDEEGKATEPKTVARSRVQKSGNKK